jgi:hypothetical protein
MRNTIDMAREAGFPLMSFEGVTYVSPELERLVALVRADEREACAKVCEELVIEVVGNSALAVDQCARAIRTRGNT